MAAMVMRESYDFSESVKNPYAKRLKKQVTIRLDEETKTRSHTSWGRLFNPPQMFEFRHTQCTAIPNTLRWGCVLHRVSPVKLPIMFQINFVQK
jgi:hypothetical protein